MKKKTFQYLVEHGKPPFHDPRRFTNLDEAKKDYQLRKRNHLKWVKLWTMEPMTSRALQTAP